MFLKTQLLILTEKSELVTFTNDVSTFMEIKKYKPVGLPSGLFPSTTIPSKFNPAYITNNFDDDTGKITGFALKPSAAFIVISFVISICASSI